MYGGGQGSNQQRIVCRMVVQKGTTHSAPRVGKFLFDFYLCSFFVTLSLQQHTVMMMNIIIILLTLNTNRFSLPR